ncbi:uncharacterized protein LOC113948942 [Corapipo altera]|uniref:uncharacterized protein LOC113948942 n=1 Tax=Corapipo altera TaxID=415028 RepID=UPI000FD6B6EF|nr:uncharacterized protein LOC113948942 [Corapipo altera]
MSGPSKTLFSGCCRRRDTREAAVPQPDGHPGDRRWDCPPRPEWQHPSGKVTRSLVILPQGLEDACPFPISCNATRHIPTQHLKARAPLEVAAPRAEHRGTRPACLHVSSCYPGRDHTLPLCITGLPEPDQELARTAQVPARTWPHHRRAPQDGQGPCSQSITAAPRVSPLAALKEPLSLHHRCSFYQPGPFRFVPSASPEKYVQECGMGGCCTREVLLLLSFVALCPEKVSRDREPHCTFLSSTLGLISTEAGRQWKTKGSPLALQGWLMGAVTHSRPLSPPGHSPS